MLCACVIYIFKLSPYSWGVVDNWIKLVFVHSRLLDWKHLFHSVVYYYFTNFLSSLWRIIENIDRKHEIFVVVALVHLSSWEGEQKKWFLCPVEVLTPLSEFTGHFNTLRKLINHVRIIYNVLRYDTLESHRHAPPHLCRNYRIVTEVVKYSYGSLADHNSSYVGTS